MNTKYGEKNELLSNVQRHENTKYAEAYSTNFDISSIDFHFGTYIVSENS